MAITINIPQNQTIKANKSGDGLVDIEKIEDKKVIHKQAYKCNVFYPTAVEKNKSYVIDWVNGGNAMPEYEIVTPPEPTFEENQVKKINSINSKTQEILYNGVTATVDGTEYTFDTCKGERAAANWQKLSDIAGKVLTTILPSEGLFPRNISTKDDEHVLELVTAADAISFLVELWTNENAIITAGAVLRKKAQDATTQEELDLVVDNR